MEDLDYNALLNKAKEQLPKEVINTERFVIPKVKGHVQGNKTIINNWFDIAKTLDRNPNHLLKYVLKELATPGEIIKQSVIFGSKLSSAKINEKIQKYADEFVFCKECGKPDTKLVKENGILYLSCHACGAKYPVKNKI